MVAWRGATARPGNGHGTDKAPLTAGIVSAQWKGGGGRPAVGLAEESIHYTLLDVKLQLKAL